MNLDERDLKKIKSLHVMLKMPIWILEKETNKVLKAMNQFISILFLTDSKKRISQKKQCSSTVEY